jgi:hypothetical protein
VLPPTATPTLPTTTTPPSLSATPTLTPPDQAWRRLSDFPLSGARITDIATYSDGFVAVGHTGECGEAHDGGIWTSADGQSWSAADVDLRTLGLTHVAIAGGTIYAFGNEGAAECPRGRNVVASSRDGRVWRVSEMGVNQSLSSFVAAAETLIAFREVYRDGELLGSAWTSSDGIDWQLRRDSPVVNFQLDAAASVGGTAVVFDDYAANPAWVSTDAGAAWRRADYMPLYAPFGPTAAAGPAGFVAVGRACCTTPDQNFGFVATSSDGIRWRDSQPFGFRLIPAGVLALPGGFATIGRQTWLSEDGLHWVVGPGVPGFELDRLSPTGAATAETAVITNSTGVWVASLAALDPIRYTETPRLAEMPQISVRYDATVFTHCGWPDTHFAMRAWVPDPPIDDINPPEGLDEVDHGWFTQLNDDRLQYESARGRIVNLIPSDEPQLSGPCA